ncbi:hypothetical protein Hokovirus_4_78 [Hokovirus HKV1]|uniref:Uncharacterized protein n=1 Tax=Hokovirus HKV1 TaxID=1977638 RepID=A0A1V0SHI7_9VIRU|nr:hypothetical protein Hokovirus_4_78 [Hokovirus HKV1]
MANLYQFQPQDNSNQVLIRKVGNNVAHKKLINRYKHDKNNITICEYLHNEDSLKEKLNVIIEYVIDHAGTKDLENTKQHYIYFCIKHDHEILKPDVLYNVKYYLLHINKDIGNVNLLYEFDKFEDRKKLLETIVNKSYKFLLN